MAPDQCILCGHRGVFEIVNTIARNATPQTSVACSRCAFVFVDPMPSESELRDYYASGQYRREFPPLRTEAEEMEIATGAAEWLTQHFGLTGSERLLEIGCGYGRVAALLSKRTHVRGWEVDPGMRNEAIARGVSVWADPAQDAPGGFDIVYAMQVLEHQRDPVATLREWRAYLAPGGRLHLQVPTLEAMYGGASYFFQKPHVVNFTRRTLRVALMLAGFDVVDIGISGSVLYATATVAEPMSYEDASLLLAPPDDPASMIAAHEADRRQLRIGYTDGAPTPLARWLDGEKIGDIEGGEDAVRVALTHAVGLTASALDMVSRLAAHAEHAMEACDGATSNNAWVRGKLAGEASTHQRYQQALAHVANALVVRLNQGGQ